MPTCFTQERDLLIAVKRAGYDATKYGVSIKTHLDGDRVFFFWELIDGRWCAVFAKGHDQAMLDRFKASVEVAAGTKVFESPPEVTTVTPMEFPTNFRDGDLLIEALTEFGAHATRTCKGDIVCKVNGSTLDSANRAADHIRSPSIDVRQWKKPMAIWTASKATIGAVCRKLSTRR